MDEPARFINEEDLNKNENLRTSFENLLINVLRPIIADFHPIMGGHIYVVDIVDIGDNVIMFKIRSQYSINVMPNKNIDISDVVNKYATKRKQIINGVHHHFILTFIQSCRYFRYLWRKAY